MHERSWMKSILPTALWRKLEKELDDEAYETPEKVPTRGSTLLHFLLPPQPFCAELVSSLSAIPAGILGLSALAQHHTNALPSSTYMMLAFLFSYSVTSYDLYLQERKQRPQTTFTEVLCAPFNGGSSLLSEWRFHIFAHAVLMILQMLLTSVMLGRCGLTRTLIIMECGHTAVAILAFASKYYVQAAIDSTYNTVPPSPRIHSRGSNTIGTNNDSNSNRVHGHRRTGSGLLDNLDSGDGSDSKGRPEDALMLSVALVGGGIAMLLYCDLHSTTSAVLLAATTLVYYIRAFYLLPLPQQIQTLPLGVASALTAPLGLRSLFTKGLTALFSPTNYLFLTTSAFSVQQ